jgi:hypothetical protein
LRHHRRNVPRVALIVLLLAALGVLALLSRDYFRSSASGVAEPAPPSSYSLPAGATVVSSSAQLTAALKGSSAKDIVLSDGTYESSSPFVNGNGSRLYAEHLGGAVLTAGLVVGGTHSAGGAIVRGLAFDISSPGKTFQDGELNIWGSAGENTQVLDCTFDGHRRIGAGVLAVNPGGLVAERLTFSDFTDEGIRASDNNPVSFGASTPMINTITDISVDGVSRNVPGSSNGTEEAGLFIGQPVRNGVARIRVRNVSISGIETANNAWNTTFSDLDIDMSGPDQSFGVGVYLERFSREETFTHFFITGVQRGFTGEWDHDVPGGAGSHSTTIENGVVDAAGSTIPGNQAGVYLDAGSESTTIENVTFKNQNWAGIGAFENIGTNTYSGNVYRLDTGAATISTKHI